MHGSIWKFNGDPADLAEKYEALLGEIPSQNMRFHACLITDDGLIMFDTCPSEQVFHDFFEGPAFMGLLEQYGFPPPEVENYPVIAAFSNGARIHP